ncbi:MAG TPA: NAD(P)H-dependent oxidoreductase subunit E [Chloroflexia bacterium]|jgi:NADH-quinone oxidoreductase subunit E/NADP-reducing hydrogenase subunit HndA
MNDDQGGGPRDAYELTGAKRPGEDRDVTGYNDPSQQDKPGHLGQDLSSVRSGDLAPYEERAPIQPLADSSAISPSRAIPPDQISAIVERYKHVDPVEAMIPVLQEMQVKFGYITQDAAEQMAVELGLTAAEVYGVITFYSFFRYTPRGGHVIMSCEGTSCYVRGAGQIREAIENRLDVGPGDTSADGFFTFEPQSICLGACDLGPLVDIEGTFYTFVTPEKMDAIITQWYEAGDETPVGDNLTGRHLPHYDDNHGFGPTADELYAGYEVAQFMPAGVGSAASNTSPLPGVEEAIQNMPPTPGTGGPSGSGSASQS